MSFYVCCMQDIAQTKTLLKISVIKAKKWLNFFAYRKNDKDDLS